MPGCARKQDSKRLWDHSLSLLHESRSWSLRQLSSFPPENPLEWVKGRPVRSAGVIPLFCFFIPHQIAHHCRKMSPFTFTQR